MATAAPLTLDVWRNDEVYEFRLRVLGPDLTGVAMRAQVRPAPDTPGPPLVDLALVTNGNAEGIRLAGVSLAAGVFTNDVRIRLNKSTRQALPYASEFGNAASLALAFQIAGRTRLFGNLRVLAHAMDSDAAPASRPPSYGAQVLSAPSAGATLTIGADDVVELTIDGADLVGLQVAEAAGYADGAGVARDAAAASAEQVVVTLAAAIGGGAGVTGGPEVGFAIDASPLSPLTWVHPEPVPRSGLLRSFTGSVKRAGAIRLGFIDDANNVMISRVVTFTGTGKQTVNVASAAVRAGWRVAILSDASNSAGGSGAQLGYMAFGTALSGPAIAADATVVSGLSVFIGATIALAYDLDAADATIAQRDLTAKRKPVYARALKSYPDAWVETSTAPWSFGAGGMTSPASGQGWGCLMQTNWWTRLERRLTRLALSGMSDATIVAPAWRAPDQGAPLNEGNGRGPSMCAVNFVNRTLAIKLQPNGNSDPGNVASVPLAAGHVSTNPQLLEWEWRVRDQILTMTDMYSGAVTTLANPVTGTATDTNLPGGNMNDALAFFAVAGRFTVSRAEVLYNRPAPKVLAIGDSITQGDQQLAAYVWSRMLDAELGGGVAISAMGGGRMRGAWFTSRAELAALRPAWVIVAVGTNNGDNDLATTQAYLGSIIRRAKSQGAKVILTTILNTDYGNKFGGYNAQNGVMTALAAADPDNVFLWRWNRALSISGQGAAADASKFHDDLVHPDDDGNTALLAQLHIDVPQLFD